MASNGEGQGAVAPADQARPARLPGLWAICVLFGLAGALNAGIVVLARPLGVLVFGGLALLSLALAVGLWVRSNAVRIVVMALVGLKCAALAVASVAAPEGCAVAVLLLCIGLVVLTYLWFCGRHFKVPAAEKPTGVGSAGMIALVLVVLFGVAWTLLLTVDEAAREFPRLEVQLPTVPEEQNAYPFVLRMAEEFSFAGDDGLDRVIRGARSPEPLEGEAWERAAANVMQRYEPCFGALDDVLARGSLIAPTYRSSMAWTAADNEWLGYCRALARLNGARVRLAIAQGRAQDALDAAGESIEFGLMLSATPNAIITYLVGRAIVSVNLDVLREVAGSEGVTVAMLRPEIERLASEERLRRGIERALAAEFVFMQGEFEDIRHLRGIAEEEDAPGVIVVGAWTALLRVPMPLLKLNMSRNLLGISLDGLVAGLDRYGPGSAPARDGPFGMPPVGGQVTWLHGLRNPVGDMIVTFAIPADADLARSHFRALAELRLTRLCLALRCHQIEHGTLPASLEELAPAYLDQVPVDPFTEERFHYEPDAEPPRLYSVGPDQMPDPPGADESDDIAVELW